MLCCYYQYRCVGQNCGHAIAAGTGVLAKTNAMLLLLTPKNSVNYMSWKKSLCELCADHSLSLVLNNTWTSGNILNTRFSAVEAECTETCSSRI
jgi:hypothetical protein